MKSKLFLPFVAAVFVAGFGNVLADLILAGTEVDQGKPGRYGSWPVSVSGGVLSLSAAVVVDGGTIVPFPSGDNVELASNGTGLSANGTPCTTAGGASCTIIFPSTSNFFTYQNITMWVINSGANPIDNVLVEASSNDVNWEVWDTSTFSGLAAGAVKSLALTGNSRRYWRLEARAAANTSVTVRFDATSQAY